MWSATIDVDGPVHLAEWGSGPARIVLVHGLGGSHLNWMRVAPQLTRYGRVLALDLPGFGLTPVNGRLATVPAYAALLDRVIDQTCTEPVVLVGNSMGGLIALTEASLHPARVAGLVLVELGPAQPLAAAAPGAGQPRLRRLHAAARGPAPAPACP